MVSHYLYCYLSVFKGVWNLKHGITATLWCWHTISNTIIQFVPILETSESLSSAGFSAKILILRQVVHYFTLLLNCSSRRQIQTTKSRINWSPYLWTFFQNKHCHKADPNYSVKKKVKKATYRWNAITKIWPNFDIFSMYTCKPL